MKLAVIALYLGCTSLICNSAVHSNFLFLAIRATLTRWGFTLPPVVTASEAPLRAVKSAPPATLRLSKAEILILIAESANKYQVPEAFVSSIVAAESNFDSTAISPKGAVGLMQLMPQTARQFGADPHVPAQNIEAGTRYLRWLMDRYQRMRHSATHVIAAYNAGPRMVDHYRGVPPFRETRNYVTRVTGFWKKFSGSESTALARTRVAAAD